MKKYLTVGLSIHALAIFACNPINFDAALNTTIEDVDEIRNDAGLSSQEKREALAELGIDDVTINGLLQGERLGNQFGGDLVSAFEKITGDRYSDLTPDELQVYGDATGLTNYSDAVAQEIADFFVEEGINSSDELEAALDDPETVLPQALVEDNLRDIFVEFDPDDVLATLP